jgi:elongation factor Ts
MINITAADVNKLRQMSGAGMMDCKKALQETEGDFDKAIDYLRKKGQKVAAKRADRDANEGIVISKTSTDNTYAGLIMVNCETDFVGKTDDFKKFAHDLLDLCIKNRPASVEAITAMKLNEMTVEEKLNEMLGKTGEKSRLLITNHLEAPFVSAYNHHGNRLATLLGSE